MGLKGVPLSRFTLQGYIKADKGSKCDARQGSLLLTDKSEIGE
jgi:hypothetical protein